MTHLSVELWRDIMCNDASREEKITSICAVLHVYGALLGMTDEDFEDLSYKIGRTYPGPFPDVFSEEALSCYENTHE